MYVKAFPSSLLPQNNFPKSSKWVCTVVPFCMQYVALLRGINVGGNKKVPMTELKSVFTAHGYTGVTTYINSGNVLFSSAQKVDASTVEHMLHSHFGFQIQTQLRSAEEIRALAKKIPANWNNDTTQRTDVLFLWDSHDSKSTLAKIHTTTADSLLYIKGCIVWNLKRINYAKSGMHLFIGTDVYKHMTARNVNTVRKLAALLS